MGEPKSKQFIIHCTAMQHARVKALAKAAGKPISHYLADLLNDGWRSRQCAPASRPTHTSAVSRDATATSEAIRTALTWLPDSGDWSYGPAPWQISNRLVHLRRSGFVESRTVREYPVKLNWRITDIGRKFLRTYPPADASTTATGPTIRAGADAGQGTSHDQ